MGFSRPYENPAHAPAWFSFVVGPPELLYYSSPTNDSLSFLSLKGFLYYSSPKRGAAGVCSWAPQELLPQIRLRLERARRASKKTSNLRRATRRAARRASKSIAAMIIMISSSTISLSLYKYIYIYITYMYIYIYIYTHICIYTYAYLQTFCSQYRWP